MDIPDDLHDKLRDVLIRKVEEAQDKIDRGAADIFQTQAYDMQEVEPKNHEFYAALIQELPFRKIIAEFKKTSPSEEEEFRLGAEPVDTVRSYKLFGAVASSILTDIAFNGCMQDLVDVTEKVKGFPILRKDFTTDEVDIYESRCNNASAVLLIAGVLNYTELSAYHARAHDLGMDAVVEVHTREEMQMAEDLGAKIIGINSRNLHDFSVDLNRTVELLPYAPKDAVVIAESGIHTPKDMYLVREADAVLIGTMLMRAKDLGKTMYALQGREWNFDVV